MTTTDEGMLISDRIIGITALILEDRTGQVSTVEKAIQESLTSINTRKIGIALRLDSLTLKKTRKEILDHIEKETLVPDWILCDLNLPEKGAGKEVAKEILHRRYPTDILLYSYKEVLEKDEKINDGRYGNIITANRNQISGSIDRLVWRAVVKLPDPEYLRGLILSRATDTESLIDDCLVSLFKISDKLKYHFKWGLLRSESYGPGFKYDVFEEYLKKTLPKGLSDCPIELDDKKEHLKTNGHLKSIFATRNLVAHGVAESDGAGGLKISNRLEAQKKGKTEEKKKEDVKEPITRDEIKSYLNLCYRTDEELIKLLNFINKW